MTITVAPRPTMPVMGIGSPQSPPISIPLRHFVTAAIAFWIFALAFALTPSRFLGFDFDALWVLGTVHTLTLGWITMTIFGVLAQLTTVLWEVPLAWPSCVKAGWWSFTIGLIAFIGHLWAHVEHYWIPAGLLVIAVGCYLAALIRTMAGARHMDWTGKHLVMSVSYLSVLVVLGFLLAYDRQRGVLFPDPGGVLIAHIHLALVGWVSLTIVGVSYRLVSMFALSHNQSERAGEVAFLLLNVGLIGLALDSLFFGHRLLHVWAWTLATGYAAYLFQMRAIFQSRLRKLDPSLSFTILALFGGVVWVVLGVMIAMNWAPDTLGVREAYLFTALLGWITPYILGQIYKIVPFLVWLEVYSPAKNKRPGPLPMMQDLTSIPVAWAELATLVPGIYLGIAGFVLESAAFLRWSGFLLLTAATLYGFNVIKTVRHLFRRS